VSFFYRLQRKQKNVIFVGLIYNPIMKSMLEKFLLCKIDMIFRQIIIEYLLLFLDTVFFFIFFRYDINSKCL